MSSQAAQKKSVMIVDDDEFLLDMYALKFREAGFDVRIAPRADAALEQLRKGDMPRVILLDVVMPQMDGFEFLSTVKKENLATDAFIIMLTNLGQKSDIDKGMRLGADDYLIKAHFTPSEIVEKVEEFLKQEKKTKS